MRVLAIDFETADNPRTSACALGTALVVGDRIDARSHQLIRPPALTFQFTHIHGIRAADVRDAPRFREAWETVAPLLDGVDCIAAHNASFDRSVLFACCDHAGVPRPTVPFLCTVKLARRVWNLRPTRLPDVCQYLGISLRHHDAASDAEACASIVLAAAREIGRAGVLSIL